MDMEKEIAKLKEEFVASQDVLVALGDENRQHLILKMISSGACQGLRVGDITKKSNLSRPAVSHHLKILKDAKIVKMRREGTKNYYYFDADEKAMDNLLSMLEHAKKLMKSLPAREGQDD